MRPLARKRLRLPAAALCALSMFSCSYGEREDKEEDSKHLRSELVLPAPEPATPYSVLRAGQQRVAETTWIGLLTGLLDPGNPGRG